MKKLLVLLSVTGLLLAACSGGSTGEQSEASAKKPIVIAGKPWTEQYILPNILAEYIRAKTDYEVEVKESLGETPVLMQAIQDGDIDLFVHYTGTGLLTVLKEELAPGDTADTIYDKVKKGYKEKYNLIWTAPFGFNNTWALTLRNEDAEKLGVKTYTDLIEKSDTLVLGATSQFAEREDGYDAMLKVYPYNFKSLATLDPNIMYNAIKEKSVDVITAFTTDGRIPRFKLKVLEDDKNFFPPYYAAPVVRAEVLEQYPELEKILNELGDKITEDKMAELNALADIDKQEPKDIAKKFLKEAGLIE